MSIDAWLENQFPRLLPVFLPTQRWFAGKARTIRHVEVDDGAWLDEGPFRSLLILVGVDYAGGAKERYAMLLAFLAEAAGLPAVGRAEWSGASLQVVEAAADARAVAALLRGFASGHVVRTLRGGGLRFAEADPAARREIARAAADGRIAPLGAEQSNTSVRVDRTLVFKLLRKIEAGEHPEVELGRFLTTRTAFRAMPALRGSVSYLSPSGESSTVGVLQQWVESAGDAWTHVVGELRRCAAEARREAPGDDLRALGVTTAEFHAALASEPADPAFAPEPATPEDVWGWRAAVIERAAGAFALVEQHVGGWTGQARQLGEAVLDLRPRIPTLASMPEPTTAPGFHKIRIHGDYHLGQVLKTPDGFALIDFEGEPERPLAERRLKHCALRDVAGLLRSLDYAVESAFGQDASLPAGRALTQHLRSSFLDGYLAAAAARRATFLPPDRRAVDAWTRFFEIEKALYEVAYEINNRPAWVGVPLRGILHVLGGA